MMGAITMNQNNVKRVSTSQLQRGWKRFQRVAWETAQQQKDDMADAGFSYSIRHIQDMRKHGLLPEKNAWAIIAAYGLPLIMEVMGGAIINTYEIMQREKDARDERNRLIGEAIFSALGGDTDRRSMGDIDTD